MLLEAFFKSIKTEPIYEQLGYKIVSLKLILWLEFDSAKKRDAKSFDSASY
jgi:hypothetical protein